MSLPASAPPLPLDAAFTALREYDSGSSRSALLPIDDAVRAALAKPETRPALERRLVAALQQGGSAVAREYLCSKLAWIGSAVSVPALAALLGEKPVVATAARNALEAIPGPEANRALRAQLPKLAGMPKVGVLQSLGVRRDEESLKVAANLLASPDQSIVSAALATLGEIGSPRSAKALRDCQPKLAAPLRLAWADACLVCAERLLAAGRREDARAIYGSLARGRHPAHVQLAAQRGLTAARGGAG